MTRFASGTAPGVVGGCASPTPPCKGSRARVATHQRWGVLTRLATPTPTRGEAPKARRGGCGIPPTLRCTTVCGVLGAGNVTGHTPLPAHRMPPPRAPPTTVSYASQLASQPRPRTSTAAGQPGPRARRTRPTAPRAGAVDDLTPTPPLPPYEGRLPPRGRGGMPAARGALCVRCLGTAMAAAALLAYYPSQT